MGIRGSSNRRAPAAAKLIAPLSLLSAADQNVVPINLQIRGKPIVATPRKFVSQVRSHGASTAGRETEIINYSNPLSIGDLRFNIRRKRLEVRLIRGVHAGGGEVFDFSVHEQPDGPPR